jgi:F-type H+-transporting ATPase subunit epsilon
LSLKVCLLKTRYTYKKIPNLFLVNIIMSSLLQIEINTPQSKVFVGEGSRLELQSKSGQIGILPGHAPYVTAVGEGEIVIYPELAHQKTVKFSVPGGVCSVENNLVKVICDSAESI